MTQRPWLPKTLLALYVPVWVACAINPLYPSDWLIENILVFLALPTLLWAWRHQRFSDGACVGIFLFFCLHSLGTHYTYAEVPYDRWWQAVTGHTFNGLFGWERNHFDRFVHLAYGLLLTPVFNELLGRVVRVRSAVWMCVLSASFMGLHAMVYELVEWATALVVAPELGAAYLGTQGDVWDAHKDMALAVLGNAITLAYQTLRQRLPLAGPDWQPATRP
jgi:putative membrane protein